MTSYFSLERTPSPAHRLHDPAHLAVPGSYDALPQRWLSLSFLKLYSCPPRPLAHTLSSTLCRPPPPLSQLHSTQILFTLQPHITCQGELSDHRDESGSLLHTLKALSKAFRVIRRNIFESSFPSRRPSRLDYKRHKHGVCTCLFIMVSLAPNTREAY